MYCKYTEVTRRLGSLKRKRLTALSEESRAGWYYIIRENTVNIYVGSRTSVTFFDST